MYLLTQKKLLTYKERVEELKESLKRTHSGRMDAMNRPITVQQTYSVHVGIKCYENKKYRQKISKGSTVIFDKEMTYEDDIHTQLRSHFNVSKEMKTYIDTYEGTSLEHNFINLEKYAQPLKEKKRAIKLYFYYPNTYTHLEFKKRWSDSLMDEEEEEEEKNENHCFEETNNDDDDDDDDNVLLPPFNDIPYGTDERRKICDVCSCSYTTDTCIRCEQDIEFQASILADNEKSSENHLDSTLPDDNSDSELSVEELRQYRLRKFINLPIRFRQSIGETISSENNGDKITFGNNNERTSDFEASDGISTIFGDAEVVRFMESIPTDEISLNTNQSEKLPSEDERSDFIAAALNQYQQDSILRTPKTVIVQRDATKFWKLLFSQKFDLKDHNLNIRFAGEAADIGGPYREFLTLCMKNLNALGCDFFGSSNELCFTGNPDRIINGVYYKLGQLTACSILSAGRGPESFHPIIVRAMYDVTQPESMENVDDAFIKQTLHEIDEEKYDVLYDLNITPARRSSKELKNMYLLTSLVLNKSAAINQFKSGMSSVAPSFVLNSSYELMKTFMVDCHKSYSFNDILQLIHYPQRDEICNGSNAFIRFQDAVIQLELLLVSIENGEIKKNNQSIGFEDFLYFVTGTDRVPPHGFNKCIDVTFDDITLPRSNTCGLSVVFPYENIVDTFIIAVQFGGGFGAI